MKSHESVEMFATCGVGVVDLKLVGAHFFDVTLNKDRYLAHLLTP